MNIPPFIVLGAFVQSSTHALKTTGVHKGITTKNPRVKNSVMGFYFFPTALLTHYRQVSGRLVVSRVRPVSPPGSCLGFLYRSGFRFYEFHSSPTFMGFLLADTVAQTTPTVTAPFVKHTHTHARNNIDTDTQTHADTHTQHAHTQRRFPSTKPTLAVPASRLDHEWVLLTETSRFKHQFKNAYLSRAPAANPDSVLCVCRRHIYPPLPPPRN